MALSPQEFEKLKIQLRQRQSAGVASPVPEKEGFLSRVTSDIKERGANFASEINNSQQNPLLSGIKATAQAFGGVADVAEQAIRTVPGGDTALDTATDVIGKGFGKVTNSIADTKLFKEASQYPEQTKILEDFLQAGGSLGEIAGTIAGAKVGVKPVQIVSDTAKQGVKATASIAKATTKGVSDTLGQTIKPENIMQRVARIPKGAQAKFEATSGESIGKYLTKRGIFGDTENISGQLFKRFTDSRNTADDALSKLEGVYNPKVLKSALQELVDREKRISSDGALSPDYARSHELLGKYNKGGLSMPEINEAKRLFERNVKLDFQKQINPEGVARASNIDDALRKWQFGQAEKLGLKNLPDINKETRLAKQLLDAIGKESAGSLGNNALTLTDYILLAGGDVTAIGAFLGKKALSSKGIQSAIAKKLYKGEKVPQPKAEFGKPKVDPRKKQEGMKSFLKRNN